MNRTKIALVLFGLALWLATSAGLLAQTQRLPISDYLDNQVTSTIWLEPANGNLLFFDAFGVLNENLDLGLGTVFGGRVTRRELNNGFERVTVVLHTKDALCFGFTGYPGALAPAFGRNALEVAGGAPASLGDGLIRIEFTLPAGDPLPAFFDMFTPPIITDLALNATIMCHGELRTESGFPPGAEGLAQTTQEGLFITGVPGGCPPETDGNCFPAEKVQFKQTSRR